MAIRLSLRLYGPVLPFLLSTSINLLTYLFTSRPPVTQEWKHRANLCKWLSGKNRTQLRSLGSRGAKGGNIDMVSPLPSQVNWRHKTTSTASADVIPAPSEILTSKTHFCARSCMLYCIWGESLRGDVSSTLFSLWCGRPYRPHVLDAYE